MLTEDEATKILISRKREKFHSEIRRNQKLSVLNEKRQKYISYFDISDFNPESDLPPVELNVLLKELLQSDLSQLEGNLISVQSTLRKIEAYYFSKESPNTESLITTGAIDKITELCSPANDKYSGLQLNCLNILTNALTCSKEIMNELLHKKRVHKTLLPLLFSKDAEIRKQALWSLGNIAGSDSPEPRDFLFSEGIVEVMNKYFMEMEPKEENLVHVLFLFNNLTRGPPFPNYEEALSILPLLDSILASFPKCYSISFSLLNITSNCKGNTQMKSLIQNNQNLIKDLIDVLNEEWNELIKNEESFYFLSFLRNITTADENDCKFLIEEFKILEIIKKMIESKTPELICEGLICLTNIFSDNTPCVQLVWDDHRKLFETLIDLPNDHQKVAIEKVLCIYNALCSNDTNDEMVEELMKRDVMLFFLEQIQLNFSQCGTQLLQGIYLFLVAGEELRSKFDEKNPYLIQFQKLNGEALIGNLQLFEDPELNNLLDSIQSFFLF